MTDERALREDAASALAYPPSLPVVAHREEILAALARSQVIVVCGDTGSGKTTQLPKMALEAGCARHGRRIACTQPRRLAAVTTAERVAAELKVAVGGLVGYQHRFARKVSDETRIKFMTDGVLLAETRGDPLLRKYDCIILDEAHERSLNVDFLLGILTRILARRRDLKVIVSSATLDTERFSDFFGGAPAIVVPGRLYPIETRDRPPPDGEERDLARDVADAVDELPPNADTLVFLPGERDIRDCAEVLRGRCGERDDILPLIASLPAAEQQRAFRPSARRRIVLATNVAETSVTIPGIRAVVDSGLARISRYVPRTQVQRLQIEPISQASARQRMGRCGRTGPGICIRLYDEADLLSRDAFTPPEILRSSLAGVILTMLDLGLGDIARFPFLDPPRTTSISEGYRELIELGAIARDAHGEPCLTKLGRTLARIPVEPRLGRMLVAASELAVLPQAIPLVAALSCDDPKRRPSEEREKAKQAHAPFRDAESDFLGTLKLWTWWREQSETLSQTKLRKLCKATYLSYPKMREWGDLVRQLTTLAERLHLDTKSANGDAAALHRALLTGLLARIGHWDPEERDYRGARGIRFALHPSSALAKKPPEWVVCGELVETARLFAREAAVLDPAWIEPAAGTLCRRHVHSPEWDAASGFVRATEQVTLYGLVIVPARRCDFSRHDPALARDLFIRRGLVDGAVSRPPPVVRQNVALLQALRQYVEKIRRPELFDEDALARHFDATLPPDLCSMPALVKWLRRATPQEIDAFRLRRRDWWPAERVADRDFPDQIRIGDAMFHLAYRHAPDEPEKDGVTCTVRRSQAAALRLWRSDWLVPGLLPEKLTWMLSVLPTSERKVLAPLDDTVAGLLAKLKPGTEPLEDAVVRTIREEWGFRITPAAWRRARMPNHLQMRFAVKDDDTGRLVGATRDKDEALRLAGVAAAEGGVLQRHAGAGRVHTCWDFGDLDAASAKSAAGWALQHVKALHDEGDGVTVRLYADAASARLDHAAGTLRLVLLALGPKADAPTRMRSLPVTAVLHLRALNGDPARFPEDVLVGAACEAFVRNCPEVRTEAAFSARLAEGMAAFRRIQGEIAALAADALVRAATLLDRVSRDLAIAEETAESIQTQLVWLTAPGFPRTTPLARLRRYETYLRGVEVRLDRARLGRAGDLAKEARFAPWWQRYLAARAATGADRLPPETLAHIRWMLEEYRISLFAQELKTSEPVSEKRLETLFAPPQKKGNPS